MALRLSSLPTPICLKIMFGVCHRILCSVQTFFNNNSPDGAFLMWLRLLIIPSMGVRLPVISFSRVDFPSVIDGFHGDYKALVQACHFKFRVANCLTVHYLVMLGNHIRNRVAKHENSRVALRPCTLRFTCLNVEHFVDARYNLHNFQSSRAVLLHLKILQDTIRGLFPQGSI